MHPLNGRSAEIHQLQQGAAVRPGGIQATRDEDVLGLHVAVPDLQGVQVRDGTEELPRRSCHAALPEAVGPLDVLEERATGAELHREGAVVGRLEGVVQTGDVGVVHRLQHARLGVESLDRVGVDGPILSAALVQNLHRPLRACSGVFREIHCARGAGAKLLIQAVDVNKGSALQGGAPALGGSGARECRGKAPRMRPPAAVGLAQRVGAKHLTRSHRAPSVLTSVQ
mmetsp:Transcript_1815/g.5333  ORF Transcript_1815/g.5333 Transcript_1815/m.5333 type:complete len:227 (+) Transcript_1815:655-1335(+)